MSKPQIYIDLFAMLADMTIANGYSRDYTSVKSVDNSSATMNQTPFISLHLGYEQQMEEGNTFLQYRSEVPVEITARVRTSGSHQTRSQLEYEQDIERSKVVEDIKKRYGNAAQEIDNCIYFGIPSGEEEPREDSNKKDMYVKYVFTMRYRSNRTD